jgi:hypothetical protein
VSVAFREAWEAHPGQLLLLCLGPDPRGEVLAAADRDDPLSGYGDPADLGMCGVQRNEATQENGLCRGRGSGFGHAR